MSTVIAQDSNEVKSTKPDFGQGKYSAMMDSIWTQSQKVYGLSPVVAEMFARALATEIGAAMANETAKLKLGKVSSGGKVSITETSQLKGIICTNTILAYKGLLWTAEAGKNGISYGNTSWEVIPQIQEYFDKLAAKVATKTEEQSKT